MCKKIKKFHISYNGFTYLCRILSKRIFIEKGGSNASVNLMKYGQSIA